MIFFYENILAYKQILTGSKEMNACAVNTKTTTTETAASAEAMIAPAGVMKRPALTPVFGPRKKRSLTLRSTQKNYEIVACQNL